MNNGGEAADQMVREGIQITETAVKLSALGAKNLAAIVLELAKENPKVRGKTNLDHLLREGKELKVFSIRTKDLGEFRALAKQYGVLFTGIKDKTSDGEFVDLLAKAEDVSKLNRIFERMGYPVPTEKVFDRKKEPTAHRSENGSTMRGYGELPINQTISKRPSVRAAIQRLKVASANAAKETVREVSEVEKEKARSSAREDR